MAPAPPPPPGAGGGAGATVDLGDVHVEGVPRVVEGVALGFLGPLLDRQPLEDPVAQAPEIPGLGVGAPEDEVDGDVQRVAVGALATLRVL